MAVSTVLVYGLWVLVLGLFFSGNSLLVHVSSVSCSVHSTGGGDTALGLESTAHCTGTQLLPQLWEGTMLPKIGNMETCDCLQFLQVCARATHWWKLYPELCTTYAHSPTVHFYLRPCISNAGLGDWIQ